MRRMRRGGTREELTELIRRERLDDPRIAEAFAEIDRAEFVPEEGRFGAYSDRPVSIPRQQTTSQPSLIARMIDAAAPKETDRVLEIGTGYGFQTALLAKLAAEVVSVERHPVLADKARANLQRAGIENAEVRTGDGFAGCADRAPFDAIIVSAAAPEVPGALKEQLADGGRLVIPISGMMGDDVILFREQAGELMRVKMITPARFVPLVPGTEE